MSRRNAALCHKGQEIVVVRLTRWMGQEEVKSTHQLLEADRSQDLKRALS